MSGRAVINAGWGHGAAINYFHRAASRQVLAGGYAFPGILDANGYPVSSPSSDIFVTIYLQREVSGYTGAWVVGWTGQLGLLRLSLSSLAGATVTTGASFANTSAASRIDFSGNNGRVVFTFNGNDSSCSVNFKSGTYDGTLSGLYICREDEEALYFAGTRIRPEYENYLAYLDPLIIRSSPLNINQSNLTRWDYRPKPDNFTHSSLQWLPSAWVGTIDGTDTYTCAAATDTPVGWTDGEIIQGYVTNANTSATPTLDCGSRGGKTIVTARVSTLSAGSITALGLYTFVYDAILDKLLTYADGVYSGPPIETTVQLANSMNKPWWFHVPFMADDAYILSMAAYLYANMQQWFVLELSNEIWNNSSGFSQTIVARERGLALGFSATNNQHQHGVYGKRFCEMVDIFKTVFGSDTRFRPTIGVHGAGNLSHYDTYRFIGTNLGAWGFDASPNRPIDKTSYISPAPYISGAQICNFDANWNNTMTEALAAADDYDSADPVRMAAALLWVDSDIRNGTRNGSAGSQTVTARQTYSVLWNDLLDSYSGKGVIEYEGGLEIAAPSTDRLTALGIDTGYSAKFTALIEAYKNSHFAKKLTMDRMQGFITLSHSVAPATFEDINDTQWALRSSMHATPYKSEEGFVKFNAGKLNLRLGILT